MVKFQEAITEGQQIMLSNLSIEDIYAPAGVGVLRDTQWLICNFQNFWTAL